MTKDQSKLLDALVALGDDCRKILNGEKKKKELSNMDWYELSLILESMQYQAASFNHAD